MLNGEMIIEYLVYSESGTMTGMCVNLGFRRNLSFLLSIYIIFKIPQEVGSRQDKYISFNQSSSTLQIHPSAYGTGAKLDVPRKTGFVSSAFQYRDATSVQFLFNNNMSIKNDEKQVRFKRQIVPLPPIRKSSGSGSASSEGEARMIAIYIDFIVDFVIYKGWSAANIIIPKGQQRSDLCDYFKAVLIRSRASLTADCGIDINIMVNGGKDNPSSSTSLIIPIFSFYFLGNKNTTGARGIAIHPKLLIHFLPSRPIFVLAGSESKDVIIDQLQPEIQTNYKWTLVSLVQTDSSRIPNPTNDTLYIDDVYGFISSDPISQSIGHWSAQKGMQIDRLKSIGLSDFQGRTLRVTTVAGPPVVFVDTSSGKVKCRGYLPDILEIVSSQLNFTFEMLTPSDKQFGNVGPNGSWSGMVGMLQRKEAEIALMSFSLTAARKTVMDFSPPVEYSSVRLLIRRDWQNAELKWSAYLRPLDSKVWLTIPIFILFGVITLAIFSRWKIFNTTPFNSAWILASCFVLQGQDAHTSIKVTPYRFVVGTFWILSVVIFASYTARLTSFLAANTENLPVKSLSEAVKNHNWKVGLVKGSAFIDRIKESRVDVLRGLYQRISEDSSSLVDSFQGGMDKVFNERYIFFTSELIPTFLIRGNCSYTWLPDKYFSGFGYMGYQKSLPFAPIISQRVSEIRQSGQMQRLFQKWWGTESVCYTASADSFLGMSLYETGTAFLILILGISLATTLLVAEYYKRSTLKIFGNNSASNASNAINTDAKLSQVSLHGSQMSTQGTLPESQFFKNDFSQSSGYTYNYDFPFQSRTNYQAFK